MDANDKSTTNNETSFFDKLSAVASWLDHNYDCDRMVSLAPRWGARGRMSQYSQMVKAILDPEIWALVEKEYQIEDPWTPRFMESMFLCTWFRKTSVMMRVTFLKWIQENVLLVRNPRNNKKEYACTEMVPGAPWGAQKTSEAHSLIVWARDLVWHKVQDIPRSDNMEPLTYTTGVAKVQHGLITGDYDSTLWDEMDVSIGDYKTMKIPSNKNKEDEFKDKLATLTYRLLAHATTPDAKPLYDPDDESDAAGDADDADEPTSEYSPVNAFQFDEQWFTRKHVKGDVLNPDVWAEVLEAISTRQTARNADPEQPPHVFFMTSPPWGVLTGPEEGEWVHTNMNKLT